MTEKQKDIYNLYIQSIAIASNRPFRPRKDFSKIKDEHKVHLQKLENFFGKFPHLYRLDFFIAPYKIYTETNILYSLNFYSSHKGLTACSAYFKQLKHKSPDDQIEYIKYSLEYVEKFCVDKQLTLDKYSEYKSVSQNDFLIHLKQHHISFYVIFAIPNLFSILFTLPSDEFSIYYGDDVDILRIRELYNNSRYAKIFIEQEVSRITKFLNEKFSN